MKKIFISIITAFLVICSNTTVIADHSFEEGERVEYGGAIYTVTSNNEERGAYYVELTKVVSPVKMFVIPDEFFLEGFEDYFVTSIGDRAFCNNDVIEEVDDQSFSGINRIGNHAFANCQNLKKISVGKGNLKTIGNKAFYNCQSLENIYIDENEIVSIGASAFEGCAKLQDSGGNGSITYFSCLETLGNRAFKGCKNIGDALLMSKKLRYIGKNAFWGASSLDYFKIRSDKLNDSNIGENAFKHISKNAVFRVLPGKIDEYKELFISKGAPDSIKMKKIITK